MLEVVSCLGEIRSMATNLQAKGICNVKFLEFLAVGVGEGLFLFLIGNLFLLVICMYNRPVMYRKGMYFSSMKTTTNKNIKSISLFHFHVTFFEEY